MATILCPNCHFANEEQNRYCIQCGTILAKICSNCQYANVSVAKFCGMCGHALIETSISMPQPAAAPPQSNAITSQFARTPTLNGQNLAAETGERELMGERHLASILLADVRGSTQLMEQIGTEDWVDVMNRIFQVLEAEIYRMGGEIDQYRGDGVLAFFGARSVHEDDPERAVLAGLSIQRSFKQFARRVEKQYPGVDLKLRIGINTGEVIVTSIGNDRYYENTAMGGAVALAARMESSAEPGTVLVSEFTYQQTEHRFNYESLGEISVKGIAQPVQVYRPLHPFRGNKRAFTQAQQWIGREEQVARLRQAFEELPSGNGSIVFVNGEKGMGKSYLIEHVWQEQKRNWILKATKQNADTKHVADEMFFFVGQCRSYGQAWPYSVWADLLNKWLHSLPHNHRQRKKEGLSEAFEIEVSQMWGDQKDQYAPYLKKFLDLPIEPETDASLDALDSEEYQRRFFAAIREWIRVLSEEKPLVLSLSNIHWVDTSSLELLKHCLSLIENHRIMWLLTMRPVRTSPAWNFRHDLGTDYPHRLIWIEIPPMTAEEADLLMDQALGENSLNQVERKMIFDRSEGNPYFMHEIIHSMISNDALTLDPDSNCWAMTSAEGVGELPDSLQGILQEHIANLSPEERHVLQVASVIGNQFWDRLLSETIDMQMDNLLVHLTGLLRNQLIIEGSFDQVLGMSYSFNSSLMRDAAYESLLKPQRAAYHLACAEKVEEWVQEHQEDLSFLSQIYGYLAHHFQQAGVPGKQMHYHVLAAEFAEKIHANDEALYHLDRAYELTQDLLTQNTAENEEQELYKIQFEILSNRRWLRLMNADILGSQQDAEKVLKLTEESLKDDPVLRIDAILMYIYPSGYGFYTTEESIQMDAMCEEALYLTRSIHDRPREMETLSKMTFLRANTRDANVYEPAMQALEIARELEDFDMQFNIVLNYGYYLIGRDQIDEGMGFVNQALEMTDKVNNPYSQMNVLSVMGPRFERTGDYYRWMVEYEQKRLELSRKIGSRMAEGNSLMYYGMILSNYLGDHKNGLEMLEKSVNLLEQSPTRLFVLLRIAQTYFELGNQEMAQEILKQAEPLTAQYHLELASVGFRLVQIMINNEEDDFDHLNKALQMADSIDQMGVDQHISQQYRMAAASHASSVHRKLAIVYGTMEEQSDETRQKRAHHLQKSLEKSELAVSIYEQFGYTNAVEITGEWVLYRMGQAFIANGRRPEALPFIRRAYDELMRKYNLIPEDAPYRQTFIENIVHHRQIMSAYRLLTF